MVVKSVLCQLYVSQAVCVYALFVDVFIVRSRVSVLLQGELWSVCAKMYVPDVV